MTDRSPSPIRTDSSNAFAHSTMRERLPAIIDEVVARNEMLPILFRRDLQHLGYELKYNYALPALRVPAPDADLWYEAHRQRQHETWLATEWFFAETFFFRQVIEAVRFWQTGLDPYQPIKQDALRSETFKLRVEQGLTLSGDPASRLPELLELAVWGNRADLSHPSAYLVGDDIHPDDLLIDQREAAIDTLMQDAREVHIVLDNFGAELAADLLLADALLGLQIAVVLHAKMHPTYVSDATAADVRWMIEAFGQTGSEATSRLRDRLIHHQENGQLRVVPDFYWNSPTFLSAMPRRLQETFSSASLVILKGDANYRRAVNDTIYPATTAPAAVIDRMPAPLLLLRTLKSDPVLGLDADTVTNLDAQDQNWRTNGQRGLIQYVPVTR